MRGEKLEESPAEVPWTWPENFNPADDHGWGVWKRIFYIDQDNPHPVLDKRELHAWYSYDFANSVFFQVIIGGYLPLLLQTMALRHAGFPDQCPNIQTNATLGMSLFNSSFFFMDNEQKGKNPCTSGCVSFEGNTYCEGQPELPAECLNANGRGEIKLTVAMGSYDMDPTEYALMFMAFSVIVQTISYISLGALGDHGNFRKTIFVYTSIVGAVLCVCCISVTPDLTHGGDMLQMAFRCLSAFTWWWLGGVFMILANLFFGIAALMYNAWLPLLTEAHPQILALQGSGASIAEKDVVADKVAGTISAYGFIWGYTGGLLCTVLTIPVAFAFSDEVDAYRVNITLAGVWWFSFSWYSYVHLKPRPGPPLPDGTRSYIRYSWAQAYDTLLHLKNLQSTFKFMLLWLVYSDGFNMIAAVAVLYANTEVDWGCIPKLIGIVALLFMTPFLGIIGLVVVDKLANKRGWHPKTIVICSLLWFCIIPIYGMIGFGTDTWGLHYGYEVLALGVVYGINIGVVQSYSRTYLSNIIPPGYESQMFSFFEITDKGSSFMGPIVISQIAAHNDIRYALIYILAMLLLPALLFMLLDPEYARKEALQYAEEHPRTDPRHPQKFETDPNANDKTFTAITAL